MEVKDTLVSGLEHQLQKFPNTYLDLYHLVNSHDLFSLKFNEISGNTEVDAYLVIRERKFFSHIMISLCYPVQFGKKYVLKDFLPKKNTFSRHFHQVK